MTSKVIDFKTAAADIDAKDTAEVIKLVKSSINTYLDVRHEFVTNKQRQGWTFNQAQEVFEDTVRKSMTSEQLPMLAPIIGKRKLTEEVAFKLVWNYFTRSNK
jgi:hypothetical protein